MYCGHGGFCTSCAFEMVTIKPECHLCRDEVKQVVQLKYPNNYMDIYQAICITDIIIENVTETGQTDNEKSDLSQISDIENAYDFNIQNANAV